MKALQMAAQTLILIAILFAGVGANSSDFQSSAEGGTVDRMHRFPSVESANLDKHPVKLPQDFAGQRNLVLIAFQREQQKDVDTWLHQMKQFEAVDSDLRYYELPVISRLNVIARWFIENGMRGGIPDHKQRERTITLYLDKDPFRAALGLPDEKRIYALLLDRHGNVLWRSEGTLDANKATSLKEILERSTRAH
jgi:hypothetical protein